MHIAFYAPMKPPDHPLPSGDRRMARAFMDLLASLGHEVDLASRFRSYDGKGDIRRQQRLEQLGQRQAARLLRRYRRRPPDLWLTYHLYHKAPDWLWPPGSRALATTYLFPGAALAPEQAVGLGAPGSASSLAAIAEAALVLAMTQHEVRGLPPVGVRENRRLSPPFLDATPFV